MAQGVAFAATDELGYEKRLTLPAYSDAIDLALNLVCPIHLKQGKYVRPGIFKLSAGDLHGYGGAQTRFRVCAFQAEGAIDGAPVDWHDVASLYRQWVHTRTHSIWRKVNTTRAKTAPVDKMAPYTVAVNYALDGPVDPNANAELAGWMEQHPLVAGDPDVPGNVNEPLPTLIRRVRSVFGPATGANAVALEAQVWGFELGGFYRYLGGLPPISDLATAEVIVQPGPKRVASIAAEPPQQDFHPDTAQTYYPYWLMGNMPSDPPSPLYFSALGNTWSARRKRARKPKALTHVLGLGARFDAAGPVDTERGQEDVGANLPGVPQNSGGYYPYWPAECYPLNSLSGRSTPQITGTYYPYWPAEESRPSLPGQEWTRVPGGYIPYWPGELGQGGPIVQSWNTLPGGYIPYWLVAVEGGSTSAAAVEPFLVFDFAGSQSRLTAALDSLWVQDITPIITTDPLYPNFDRFRFRGHRIQGADGRWQDAIPYDFPPALRAFLRGRVDTAST
ncbi:MAG: hypothetical protein WAU16_10165, partial [Rhizobiaceae bacterium]